MKLIFSTVSGLWLMLSLLCVSLVSCVEKEIFEEGKITYRHYVKMADALDDPTQIRMEVGSGSEFYFKEGNYCWKFNDSQYELELFRREDEKVYTATRQNDTLNWFTSNNENVEIDTMWREKDATSILGYSCDRLHIVTTHMGSKMQTYRQFDFSDEFPIDPIWFAELRHNVLDDVYREIQAVPLRIKVIVLGFYEINFTAVKIQRESIDNKLLELPEHEELRRLFPASQNI